MAKTNLASTFVTIHELNGFCRFIRLKENKNKKIYHDTGILCEISFSLQSNISPERSCSLVYTLPIGPFTAMAELSCCDKGCIATKSKLFTL